MEEISIDILLEDVKKKLTITGAKNVFEDGNELKAEDMINPQDPEEFTRNFIIDKIIGFLNIELIGTNIKFKTPKRDRKVDYGLKSNNVQLLLEAKAINKDLFQKGPEGAVNQIKGIFTLVEAKDNYNFGIASDGLKWIFINNQREEVDELNLITDYEKIKAYLKIRRPIPRQKRSEITKKFYMTYNDILHGTHDISEKDCFVNTIQNVEKEEDREEIAQLIINRLIFIKFLHERGFIRTIKYDADVFQFIKTLPTYELNAKLRELFFEVLNKPKKERAGLLKVDPHFYEIPYLNGSLFDKADVERNNPDYSIDANILRYTIKFLDVFKFSESEELKPNQEAIDPEILGYIFEKAMNATDRKGTGSFYTDKIITNHMARNSIYPKIIEKTIKYLINDKGYTKEQVNHLTNIDSILNLPPIILDEILNNVIYKITICDPAVGSGAFLLASAQTIFDLVMKINIKLNNKYIGLEPEIKKKIIYNLYAVDINPRAIEISRLRLWLWLVVSYITDYVQPLPNLDCNICVGNALVGLKDISKYNTNRIQTDLLEESPENIEQLLQKYEEFKNSYKYASGEESKKLKTNYSTINTTLLVDRYFPSK